MTEQEIRDVVKKRHDAQKKKKEINKSRTESDRQNTSYVCLFLKRE